MELMHPGRHETRSAADEAYQVELQSEVKLDHPLGV
jgi:hypothetical protein